MQKMMISLFFFFLLFECQGDGEDDVRERSCWEWEKCHYLATLEVAFINDVCR